MLITLGPHDSTPIERAIGSALQLLYEQAARERLPDRITTLLATKEGPGGAARNRTDGAGSSFADRVTLVGRSFRRAGSGRESEVVRGVAVTVDVTEHRRSQEAL
jgi:hypothetical protein